MGRKMKNIRDMTICDERFTKMFQNIFENFQNIFENFLEPIWKNDPKYFWKFWSWSKKFLGTFIKKKKKKGLQLHILKILSKTQTERRYRGSHGHPARCASSRGPTGRVFFFSQFWPKMRHFPKIMIHPKKILKIFLLKLREGLTFCDIFIW